MQEIYKGRVSPALWNAFGEQFLQKYKLEREDWSKPSNDPCVYFGCYSKGDLLSMLNNKSDFKILVYGGTDAMSESKLSLLKKFPNLYHVAISDYIAKDLSKAGIPYKKVPITPIDHSKLNITPEPLGNSIYIYNNSEAAKYKYGYKLYSAVQEAMPEFKFNICGHSDNSREELMKIYKECFIALRLIQHDGLSNSVVEMGLMGRRTIHNGGLPSSIAYDSNVESICKIIKEESKKIGTTDAKLATDTMNFLNNSRDWLKRSFWT